METQEILERLPYRCKIYGGSGSSVAPAAIR
jgi:hypothetical protein